MNEFEKALVKEKFLEFKGAWHELSKILIEIGEKQNLDITMFSFDDELLDFQESLEELGVEFEE